MDKEHTNCAMNGARIEPNRAQKFPELDATDRITVGYTSTTQTYNRLNAMVQAIFPRFTNIKTPVDSKKNINISLYIYNQFDRTKQITWIHLQIDKHQSACVLTWAHISDRAILNLNLTIKINVAKRVAKTLV